MCPKKHESSSPAGSRRSPRAFRRGMLAGATVREAGARTITPTSGAAPVRRCAARRCWRRRRPSATRSAHPFPSGSAAPPTLRTSVSAHQRFRFPPFDPVREAGARTDSTLFTSACSSPPAVALRPRLAARSPMSGASWPATEADGERMRNAHPPPGQSGSSSNAPARAACPPTSAWHIIAERAPPWSRRSPRALRFARRSSQLHLPTGVLVATSRRARALRCVRR
jgi:hypothetical protein